MFIATFYDNAFERQFARQLRVSASFFGIRCELLKRGPAPASPSRARFKSDFLLKQLAITPAEDILLVDPDAAITRRPAILLDEKDFDLGLYYDQKTLSLSGPMFFRNNPRVRRVIQEWQVLNNAFPEHSETEMLSRLLSRPHLRLSVRRLPVTYAWIERIDRERHPFAEPVLTNFKSDSLSSRIRILG